MKIDTEEKFEEFIYETIPCALFHVDSKDRLPNGARCDEVILIGLLNSFPEVLKFKTLDWFVQTFIVEHDKLYGNGKTV